MNLHPLIKVPTIVGTVLTVLLAIAGALSHLDISWAAMVGTAGTTVLTVLSGLITEKTARAKGIDMKPHPAAAATGMGYTDNVHLGGDPQ